VELRAAKGTRDVLPGEVEIWQRIEQAVHRIFAGYGGREIRTPLFEPTELFVKSTGSDTDVVTKEMYTFEDRAGRSLTLRPEGTPGVARALLEHGLLRRGDGDRVYYIGPMFRYERPQKGRSRQFSQIGAEWFGSPHPAVDAEVMEMALALFTSLELSDLGLTINSVGHAACRAEYRRKLREALLPRQAELCPDCQRRLDANPLRILDCKVPSCQPIKDTAPVILDSLCGECRAHFDAVRGYLDVMEVQYTVNPRLVRGLDYYTRTTFEVTGGALGAQNALCGGGRYDDLVGSMGGPPTPAFGFAIGLDRLVLMVAAEQEAGRAAAGAPATDIYIAHLGEEALRSGLAAARALRRAGLTARLEPDARDMKKQMSRAAAAGARYTLILAEAEMARRSCALKRMSDGVQTELPLGDWQRVVQEMAVGR